MVWRYLQQERTWDSRGTLLRTTYSGLPNHLSGGAYNKDKKQLYFFTDTQVYSYDMDQRNAPKFRSEQKLPRNLRNSIVGAIYLHNEVYVITAKTIRSFHFDRTHHRSSEQNLSDRFPRLTGTVATAFSYGDVHHFFTSDRLIYSWNERSNAWQTFGKPMETNWLACPST